jgi:hypothetical protein
MDKRAIIKLTQIPSFKAGHFYHKTVHLGLRKFEQFTSEVD